MRSKRRARLYDARRVQRKRLIAWRFLPFSRGEAFGARGDSRIIPRFCTFPARIDVAPLAGRVGERNRSPSCPA